MSQYIHKSHNVTVLLYHLVFPAKYRRTVIDEDVDGCLKEMCLEIAKRYEIFFLEIGTDKDHVHFLVQSVPTYSVTKIVKMIKSITMADPKDDDHFDNWNWYGGPFDPKGFDVNTTNARIRNLR